jgi:two-component system, OmpR family, sensor histidine kinase KdpD
VFDRMRRGPAGREDVRRAIETGAATTLALAVGTLVVFLLESPPIGIADASPVYLIPVVFISSRYGTWPGLVTAVAAVAVYDLLFTEPRFTLVVADPREWLDLILFLFVALAVGRLVAINAERAAVADRRAGESEALFAVSRQLASSEFDAAVQAIAERLQRDTGFDRVWVSIEKDGRERVIGDTSRGQPIPASALTDTLVRPAADEPTRWLRAHEQLRRAAGLQIHPRVLRVPIEADGDVLGSLSAVAGDVGRLSPETTRLLALAADQLGLALHRDRLRRAATDAEIARRSDELKSALVASVSHDLRTPLASIRAAAENLLDPEVAWTTDEVRAAATSVESEADRLDRLVRGLLDLSRIEAGTLRPEFEVCDLGSMVEEAVDRLRRALGDRPLTLHLPETLPPVRVDALLFDQLLSNLIENVARHAPPPAPIEVRADEVVDNGHAELVVEDGGPGVPAALIDRLFESPGQFDRRASGSRRGTGTGLVVVAGFARAMDIGLSAGRSRLGGLAVTLRIPLAGASEVPSP